MGTTTGKLVELRHAECWNGSVIQGYTEQTKYNFENKTYPDCVLYWSTLFVMTSNMKQLSSWVLDCFSLENVQKKSMYIQRSFNTYSCLLWTVHECRQVSTRTVSWLQLAEGVRNTLYSNSKMTFLIKYIHRFQGMLLFYKCWNSDLSGKFWRFGKVRKFLLWSQYLSLT